jgi:hypothetical protein
VKKDEDGKEILDDVGKAATVVSVFSRLWLWVMRLVLSEEKKRDEN